MFLVDECYSGTNFTTVVRIVNERAPVQCYVRAVSLEVHFIAKNINIRRALLRLCMLISNCHSSVEVYEMYCVTQSARRSADSNMVFDVRQRSQSALLIYLLLRSLNSDLFVIKIAIA